MFSLRSFLKFTHSFGLKRFNKYSYAPLIKPHFFFSVAQNSDKNFKNSQAGPLYDIESELRKGREYLEQNKLEESLNHFQQTLNQFTKTFGNKDITNEEKIALFNIHFELGKALKRARDFPKALEHYSEALDLSNKVEIPVQETITLYNSIGVAYLHQSKLEEARTYLEKARNISETSSDNKHILPQQLENSYLTALVELRQGQYDVALELLEKVLRKLQASSIDLKRTNFELFDVFRSVGDVYAEKEDSPKALHYWNQGVEYVISKYGKDSMHLIPLYEKIVEQLFALGRYKEAILNLDTSIELCKKYYNQEDSELGKHYFMLGLTWHEVGDYNKALENHENALRIFKKYTEQYYEEITYSYLAIAQIHIIQKNEKGAIESYEKGLEFSLQTLGEEHPRLAEYYLFWADLLRQQNKIGESKEFLKKALNIYLISDAVDNSTLIDLYWDLGNILYKEGNLEEALNNYQQCSEYCREDPSQSKTAEKVYNSIGLVYFQQEKFEESARYFQIALEMCLGSDSKKGIDIYYKNLGLALEKQGMLKDCINCFLEALEVAEKDFGKNSELTREYFEIAVDRMAQAGLFEEIEKLRTKYPERTYNL